MLQKPYFVLQAFADMLGELIDHPEIPFCFDITLFQFDSLYFHKTKHKFNDTEEIILLAIEWFYPTIFPHRLASMRAAVRLGFFSINLLSDM